MLAAGRRRGRSAPTAGERCGPPRSSAPRSRRRGSGASIYVVGGFDRATARTARRPWSATTSGANRWRRMRPMPLRAEPHHGHRAPRAALRARRLRGARPRWSPTAALSEYQPAPRPLARGCGPRRPRGPRTPRPWWATACTWRAGPTRRARSARSRVYDFAHAALAPRTELPGPGAQPPTGAAAGGRFYVLAGRDSGNFAVAERYDPGARRWERLPDLTRRPRRDRRGARCRRADRRVRRRGARPGRHDHRAGRAVRHPQAALAAAARHAHPAPRARRRGARRSGLRDRGRAAAGLPLLARDRGAATSADRVFPLKDDIPTQRFPMLTVLIIVACVRRVLRLRGGRSTSASTGNERGARVRRDPVRDHASRQRLRAHRGRSGGLRGTGRRVGRGARPGPLVGHGLHLDVHARQPAPPRRATCCSSGSSGTTSRTRWAGRASWRSTCWAGSRRCSPSPHRPGRRRSDRRRERGDRGGARRLRDALPARAGAHGRVHHHLLHRSSSCRRCWCSGSGSCCSCYRPSASRSAVRGRGGVLRSHRRLRLRPGADQGVRRPGAG